jgi:O-methyltransferase involved in polyketide biosynthesis
MTNTTVSEQMLASTARWIAAVRAKETLRADGLVSDPWAHLLAGSEDVSPSARRSPSSNRVRDPTSPLRGSFALLARPRGGSSRWAAWSARPRRRSLKRGGGR